MGYCMNFLCKFCLGFWCKWFCLGFLCKFCLGFLCKWFCLGFLYKLCLGFLRKSCPVTHMMFSKVSHVNFALVSYEKLFTLFMLPEFLSLMYRKRSWDDKILRVRIGIYLIFLQTWWFDIVRHLLFKTSTFLMLNCQKLWSCQSHNC
jgi:hypothetical protein